MQIKQTLKQNITSLPVHVNIKREKHIYIEICKSMKTWYKKNKSKLN